jgi:hypothetical protein
MKALLKFIFPVQSEFVRTQLNTLTVIILGAVKAANKFHIVKKLSLLSIG